MEISENSFDIFIHGMNYIVMTSFFKFFLRIYFLFLLEYSFFTMLY